MVCQCQGVPNFTLDTCNFGENRKVCTYRRGLGSDKFRILNQPLLWRLVSTIEKAHGDKVLEQ